MERNPYEIVIRPLMTEKGTESAQSLNAYYFEVASDANKIEIKKAIEKIYEHKKIKVKKVRTLNKKSKVRRVRLHKVKTKAWKKAIVYLHSEHKLDLIWQKHYDNEYWSLLRPCIL